MSDSVVLDACCLINLAAADALETWLGELGLRWILPEAVLAEALFLRRGAEPAADDVHSSTADAAREPILLDPHIESGLLTVVRPETEAELAAYVALAAELDDGEAMALAIARCRSWQLATDDRKAIRLAGEAGVLVLTTPAVLNRWVDRLGPSAGEVRSALIAIRDRARFLPSGRDPFH
ncbi:hypothetical protein [uncultured Thiohalocapsa sp.]|uniref:hypothetical protein n=1 Tax=uncultured Thiohalocapsa sp. TaxID=768990 RepID=UPI0025EEDB49|nr:hypothetical protein [uncultured Thiohalocapsa sp.]